MPNIVRYAEKLPFKGLLPSVSLLQLPIEIAAMSGHKR
jgi:hypothetical protein